jgi:hypothetical protein
MAEHAGNAPTHPEHAHREPAEHTRPASMSQTTRIVVGILAFLPLALAVMALIHLAATPGDPVAAGAAVDTGGVFIGVILLLALLTLFFAAFVFNDRRIPTRSKGAWLIGFLVGGPVVIPLYWYMNVLHAPRRGTEP